MSNTALVTGCSSGFGRAAIAAFRKNGWNVAATMRSPGRWTGPEDDGLLVLPLDVTDAGSIKAALSAAADRFGRIDAVVNNAGRGLLSVFEATPREVIEAVFAINVLGPMAVMREAIPYLRRASGGRIVNVTSGSAIVPEPLMSIYSASKAALDSFGEAVRFELATQGIMLKLVVPGFVPGTGFVEQTQAAARSIPVPEGYGGYLDQRLAAYASAAPTVPTTDEDVANAIVAAAADETGRLRWLVGPDVAENAHHRWETSDADYTAWTQAMFAPAARPAGIPG